MDLPSKSEWLSQKVQKGQEDLPKRVQKGKIDPPKKISHRKFRKVRRKAETFNSRAKGVHVCVDDDEDEGDDEVEDQPDVDHLDVGCHW